MIIYKILRELFKKRDATVTISKNVEIKLKKLFETYFITAKIIENENEKHYEKINYYLEEIILFCLDYFLQEFHDEKTLSVLKLLVQTINSILLEYGIDSKIFNKLADLLKKINEYSEKYSKLNNYKLKLKTCKTKKYKKKILKKVLKSSKRKHLTYSQNDKNKIENYFLTKSKETQKNSLEKNKLNNETDSNKTKKKKYSFVENPNLNLSKSSYREDSYEENIKITKNLEKEYSNHSINSKNIKNLKDENNYSKYFKDMVKNRNFSKSSNSLSIRDYINITNSTNFNKSYLPSKSNIINFDDHINTPFLSSKKNSNFVNSLNGNLCNTNMSFGSVNSLNEDSNGNCNILRQNSVNSNYIINNDLNYSNILISNQENSKTFSEIHIKKPYNIPSYQVISSSKSTNNSNISHFSFNHFGFNNNCNSSSRKSNKSLCELDISLNESSLDIKKPKLGLNSLLLNKLNNLPKTKKMKTNSNKKNNNEKGTKFFNMLCEKLKISHLSKRNESDLNNINHNERLNKTEENPENLNENTNKINSSPKFCNSFNHPELSLIKHDSSNSSKDIISLEGSYDSFTKHNFKTEEKLKSTNLEKTCSLRKLLNDKFYSKEKRDLLMKSPIFNKKQINDITNSNEKTTEKSYKNETSPDIKNNPVFQSDLKQINCNNFKETIQNMINKDMQENKNPKSLSRGNNSNSTTFSKSEDNSFSKTRSSTRLEKKTHFLNKKKNCKISEKDDSFNLSGKKRKTSMNYSNTDDEILAYQTPVKLVELQKSDLSPNTAARKNLMDIFSQFKK